MLFLRDFKQLISTDAGQVVTRQHFFVTFSGGGENFFPDNLGLYIQNFDLPNLALDEDGAAVIKNPRGTYKVPGDSLIIPESNSFSIDFLETELPIIETVFVPWLEKVVNIRESNTYPFPKAKVRVDILSVVNPEKVILAYEFYGVYPIQITLPTLGQEAATTTSRPITFAFDKTKVIYVTNSGNNDYSDGLKDSVIDSTKVQDMKEMKRKENERLKQQKEIIKNKQTKTSITIPTISDIKISNNTKSKKVDFGKIINESLSIAKDINKVVKKPLDINNIKILKRAKNKTVDAAISNVLDAAKIVNKSKKGLSR